ncbi:MAG: amidase, partial [Pseudomonadales bacterium]
MTAAAARLKSGEWSAAALTDELLERIAILDPQLHGYARLRTEQARQSARELDQLRDSGAPLGLLHGVPVAVKDLLFIQGEIAASGTKVMADFRPDYTATVVQRLEQAGAVIIGQTQLTEGAFGLHHPELDAPLNPWNADYWPGVSSSGSGAVVAAGLAYAALGTDTGGSIRFPSACCGLVGIKPSYGRVSRYGAWPLAQSLDHIGPMARSVADAARVLQVIAGPDANDPSAVA